MEREAKAGLDKLIGMILRHRELSDPHPVLSRLLVAADQPQALLVTYWGSDGGNRVFDVVVDGTKVATQKLRNNRPDTFYDETYSIPQDLTKDKQTVLIRFQAHSGCWAGGVFGLRVVKREARLP